MLARAQRRGYSELIHADLTDYLRDVSQAFDLIVAADTLCYFGPLEDVISLAARALKPGGALIFTLDDALTVDLPDGAQMRKSLAGVRVRVERLMSSLGNMDGCATCRDDTMPRIRHVFYGEQVGDPTGGPLTCPDCGRKYRDDNRARASPRRGEWGSTLMRSLRAVLSRVNEIAERAQAAAAETSPDKQATKMMCTAVGLAVASAMSLTRRTQRSTSLSP